jgi:hypothetical protein
LGQEDEDMRDDRESFLRRAVLRTTAGLIAVLGMVPACGTGNDGTIADNGGDTPSGASSAGTTPTPVAALTLASGNVVEFYGFKDRALVTERGEAYTSPGLKFDSRERLSLLDIWGRLSPTVQAPQALHDLQKRLGTASPPDSPGTGTMSGAGEALDEQPIGEQEEGLLAAPQGCSNGCCDRDWLPYICWNVNAWTQYSQPPANSWYYVNYFWSHQGVSNVFLAHDLVCGATGTSAWHINVDGDDYYWSVNEATYRVFHWWNSGWTWGSGENFNAWVNTPATSKLHAHCGYIQYQN